MNWAKTLLAVIVLLLLVTRTVKVSAEPVWPLAGPVIEMDRLGEGDTVVEKLPDDGP